MKKFILFAISGLIFVGTNIVISENTDSVCTISNQNTMMHFANFNPHKKRTC